MELAVPKMDQRSQISFVLGSNIIKIIKNDRVHRFLAYEGENILSRSVSSCVQLLVQYPTALLLQQKDFASWITKERTLQ